MFFSQKNFCQQKTEIFADLDLKNQKINVTQSILYTNFSNYPLSKIVLNDWNNAYSDKNSALGKRFSDEYVRSFQLSSEAERGNTTIEFIKTNNEICNWNRLKNQIDLIEIELKNDLQPNETVVIHLNYYLKIPDSKFTRFGRKTQNYYLRNCFISVAKLNEKSKFVNYSNENLDDIANANYENLELEIEIPKNFDATSNSDLESKTEKNETSVFKFKSLNISEIDLNLEKKSSFESFKNEKIEVQTNLNSSKISDIQKAIIVDKIVNFVAENLGVSSQKKIIVSEIDYERNPFYGLNQLPSFISPFRNEFVYEIKFLKTYLYSYLKANLKTDIRKNSYIIDAIQQYTIMKYMDENYPDMKMLGSISSLKILKSYKLTKSSFNDQYHYLYLLMARDNIDQAIGDSKETFIKFNEQIAGKYKAGLCFRYLETFLNDNSVNKSFKEFLELNKTKQTNSSDFETIVKKNATRNIDWFFPNLINSRNTIDYKLDKFEKTENEIKIQIKNNSNATVPIPIYGIKNNEIVFQKWIENVKTDTLISIKNQNIDQLVLNLKNEVPEYNSRNNFKNLKGFFHQNRPIKFNFFKDIEDPKYNQIFYIPEFSFNLYDGLLLSMGLNNNSFLEKPFTFNLQPAYSTNTKSLSGSGSIAINENFRESSLYNIRYGLSGSYFHYVEDANYLRVIPTIQFRFRDKDFRKNKKQYIGLREIIVDKEESRILNSSNLNKNDDPLKYSVFDLRYVNQDSELAKSISYGGNLQFSNNFGKIAAEMVYRNLATDNSEISVRVYVGSFLYKNTNSSFFDFGLDRPKDYLFDYNYYGRSESTGFFSQQFITAEGGFKSKFANPYANQWLTSINGNASIWKWIQIYGDFGFYKNNDKEAQSVFDSGVHLNLVTGYFELFFPVLSSNGLEIKQPDYQQKVRFVITLSPRTLIGLFTRKWF